MIIPTGVWTGTLTDCCCHTVVTFQKKNTLLACITSCHTISYVFFSPRFILHYASCAGAVSPRQHTPTQATATAERGFCLQFLSSLALLDLNQSTTHTRGDTQVNARTTTTTTTTTVTDWLFSRAGSETTSWCKLRNKRQPTAAKYYIRLW